MNNLVYVFGVVLAFISGYLLFLLKKKYAIPSLEYEKISSLSLISMDERITHKTKITYDEEPINNIFSFRFRIRNIGKVPVKRIPIIIEFNDENAQVLDIKGYFEAKDREKSIEYSLNSSKRNRARFVIKPGLDKWEKGEFDIFTKDNKTADLTSLMIKLGEETLGIHWRNAARGKTSGTELLISVLLATGITLIVAALAKVAGVGIALGAFVAFMILIIFVAPHIR